MSATRDLRPNAVCPKCAHPNGFSYCPPVYVGVAERIMGRGDVVISEHLEWTCVSCGYVIETPTADADA